jgi:protocatechuate 3,4-dioxygenase beta subunit
MKLLALSALLLLAVRSMDDVVDSAAAALRRGDASAEETLKRLIDSPHPVPHAQSQRIREVLRASAHASTTTVGFAGEPGTPMVVSGRVLDEQGQPVAGAVLYVFHADADGFYARDGEMNEADARLFGFLRTGADGRFSFRTPRPGGYRKAYKGLYIPRHIHFEVTAAGRARRAFQMTFRDDPRMDAHWLAWARALDYPVVDVATSAEGVQQCRLDIILKKERRSGG